MWRTNRSLPGGLTPIDRRGPGPIPHLQPGRALDSCNASQWCCTNQSAAIPGKGNVTNIRTGYQRFKDEKQTAELAATALKHGLPPESLRSFFDTILARMIFDGEQLTELLVPLLKRRAGGRDIWGLRA